MPYHYVIELRPDIYLEEPPFPFAGQVEVFFNCSHSTNTVYLNSAELEIDPGSIELGVAPESPIQPEQPEWESFETDDVVGYMRVDLINPLVEGAHYWIRLNFSGTLREHVDNGFYWDYYEKQSETR